MRAWLRAASEGSVLRRALASCVLVGVALTVINHGSQLIRGELNAGLAAQIGLTLLVPFLVSLFSSVAASRDLESKRDR